MFHMFKEYINLKRKSRDMETETEEDLLIVSWEPVSQVSLNDKSVSTSEDTSAEDFVGDTKFAGLSI